MQLKQKKKSPAKALTILSLIWLSGCGTEAIPDACAWLKPIDPSQGFQDRWTADEMRQIDALDQNIDRVCRRQNAFYAKS